MRHFIKPFSLLLSILILFSGCNLFTPREQKLIIGVDPTYYPYEFLDQLSKLKGFDIDLAELIAKKMDKSLVIESIPFYEQPKALEEGKIDMILAGMTITPEREKKFIFVPYHSAPVHNYYLVFWNKIPNGIHTIADFEKRPEFTISVEKGTLKEDYLLTLSGIAINNNQISNKKLLQNLKKGKTTAVLLEPEEAHYMENNYPNLKLLNVPLPQEYWSDEMGIAIKKGNDKLAKEVSQVISELRQDGTLPALEKAWFGKTRKD